VALLALKEAWIDRTENLFRARRFDPEAPNPLPGTRRRRAPVAAAVNFGDAFTLHGYELPRRPATAGEPLRVDLYLSARQPPEARAGQGPYRAYARLVDGDGPEGRLWSLPYNGAPEGHRPPPPTTIWPTDAYGHWAHLVYTLPGTPPGTYWIQVGLFEEETWRGLNVLDGAGRIAGLSTRIGPVEIARPQAPPDVAALDIERPASIAGPNLRYLGSTVDLHPIRAGDELGLTLFWQATQPPAADHVLRLAWRSGDTALPLAEDLPLGRYDHPTSAWQAGEIVRSPHRLRVPASAKAGPYAVEATVVEATVVEATVVEATDVAATGQAVEPTTVGPFVVAEGTLEPTDRQMAAPEDLRRRVDANLGGRVVLLGYDLPTRGSFAPGEALPVTLYWRAERAMDASYKVFVQLVPAAPAAGVLAQSDAVPANWQRPTTGWAPGEVVADAHVLDVPADAPPGEYTLIAGMYEEGTLQRLALLDQGSGTAVGDHVQLEGVTVE
jgi:hypothetical protein